MNRRNFLVAGTVIAATGVGTRFLFERFNGKTMSDQTQSNPKFEVTKTEAEWRQVLTPAQFQVLRQHGTERAHTSELDKQYEQGVYRCAGCDQPLFSSETKFNSGTGWPSFYAPLENAVETSIDKTLWMTRVEVHCDRCGGHLGHVFDDGPRPTGKRYCINGVSLKFSEA